MRCMSSNRCNWLCWKSRWLVRKPFDMMMSTIQGLTNELSVSQTLRLKDTNSTLELRSIVTVSTFIEGNQYTYKGNKFYANAANKEAVQDNINMTILNQEIGKSPIEYTNQLSRAKIYDMKGIRVQD